MQRRDPDEQPLPRTADAGAVENRRQEQEPDTDNHMRTGDLLMAPESWNTCLLD